MSLVCKGKVYIVCAYDCDRMSRVDEVKGGVRFFNAIQNVVNLVNQIGSWCVSYNRRNINAQEIHTRKLDSHLVRPDSRTSQAKKKIEKIRLGLNKSLETERTKFRLGCEDQERVYVCRPDYKRGPPPRVRASSSQKRVSACDAGE